MHEINYYINEKKNFDYKLPDIFNKDKFEDVINVHKKIEGYEMTPLVALPNLAQKLNIKNIYIKDESKRFGLNAFKALGASYAISKLLEEEKGENKDITFVTATDGNHGRAVAWAASKKGYKSVVFMPKGSSQSRLNAINSIEGARASITDMNYDDAVRYAQEYAIKHGGYFVQDTAMEGYEKIPWDITLGYTHMVMEAINQLNGVKPTHVFVQAGVGSMAGGVVGYLAHLYGKEIPHISLMESLAVPCILESVRQDKNIAIGGEPKTIMAGLNCGEANPLTLPILKAYCSCFFSLEDSISEEGMGILAHPQLGDIKITSGECGAVGMGLLKKIITEEKYKSIKEALKLDQNSIILLFSTEGDTDPEFYKNIITKYPSNC